MVKIIHMNDAKLPPKPGLKNLKSYIYQYLLNMLYFCNYLSYQLKNGFFARFFDFFNSHFKIKINVINIGYE